MTETIKRKRGRPVSAPPTRARLLKLTDADWLKLMHLADKQKITWPQVIRNFIHQHKESAPMTQYARTRQLVTDAMQPAQLFAVAVSFLADPEHTGAQRDAAVGLMAELLTFPDDDLAGWCDWLAEGDWHGAETLAIIQAEIDEKWTNH